MKVRENNIDFAIDNIKRGIQRHLIINDLIASHRAMELTQANQMLNDLYEAYGGEHKKENRRGYIYGAMFMVVALAVGMLELNKNEQVSPKLEVIGLVCGVLGIFSFILALTGRFREEKVNRFAGGKKERD